jgi:GGDEF domain-containing protein
VSIGTAVYPHDGDTIDELLAAADRALYLDKGSSKRKLRLPR